MSSESNHDNSERNNRGQRLLAYLGIAGFATGITVTLGTMLGVGGSAESASVDEPISTSEYAQPADEGVQENSQSGEATVFLACVGGLAVFGGVIAYRTGVDMIREYTSVPLPQAELQPTGDDYLDEKFKQLVEPLRGTMGDCGW